MRESKVVELLRSLIRFDTSNPPGNERPCIEFIQGLLDAHGVKTTIAAKDPNRPNLIARVPGRTQGHGLLLFGHVDVVTTANQPWSVPPFDGRVEDGYVWGRGALDMKSGLAMMIDALIRIAASDSPPECEIVFAALSDEEAGGRWGAQFLVEEHPELFAGVRYALGEFGGFPVYLNRVPVYLVQVAEKQPCWMQVTFRGAAGHGALTMRDGAMSELGRVLTQLNRKRMPVHLCLITKTMVRRMSCVLPWPRRFIFRRMLDPRWTNLVLRLLGQTGRNLDPLFRNTVNATVVRGGDKPNVIPAEVSLGLDGRLLPGFTPEDLISELGSLLGRPLDSHVLLHDHGADEADLRLLPLLGSALRRAHPESHVAPYLLPGSSDARFFSRLGIQTYGFLPMNLPPGFNFLETIHAADERIPLECLEFGAEVLHDVVTRYGAFVTAAGDPAG